MDNTLFAFLFTRQLKSDPKEEAFFLIGEICANKLLKEELDLM